MKISRVGQLHKVFMNQVSLYLYALFSCFIFRSHSKDYLMAKWLLELQPLYPHSR